MTDTNDSADGWVRKETPNVGVMAHMMPSTKIAIYDLDVIGELRPTLRLDGDSYGGITVFFHDRDQVETMRDYLSAYLDGAAS